MRVLSLCTCWPATMSDTLSWHGTADKPAPGQVELRGESVTASLLEVGNPQCIVLGPLPDADLFNRLGPALATHPMFPAGTNVEFAEVEAPIACGS